MIVMAQLHNNNRQSVVLSNRGRARAGGIYFFCFFLLLSQPTYGTRLIQCRQQRKTTRTILYRLHRLTTTRVSNITQHNTLTHINVTAVVVEVGNRSCSPEATAVSIKSSPSPFIMIYCIYLAVQYYKRDVLYRYASRFKNTYSGNDRSRLLTLS